MQPIITTEPLPNHCQICHLEGLDSILADYRCSKDEIISEAWTLGWRVEDVKGSLDDLDAEEGEVVEEWVACCSAARWGGVEGGNDGVVDRVMDRDVLKRDLPSEAEAEAREGRGRRLTV